MADLIKDNDPLVYAQEHCAEFVDWAGAAFFSREKLLDQRQPVACPTQCGGVFAVIDTASKTGTENDATAVTYFAVDPASRRWPLTILDWDIAQIEGDLLETWLPSAFRRLEDLARMCRARSGSLGAWIEDKNSGTTSCSRLCAGAFSSIPSNRAISVSGYVHRGQVKYSEHAFAKTTIYKQKSRNHLLEQVEAFLIRDGKNKREDDLLDTFCYGIAIALGNDKGFYDYAFLIA